LARASAQQPINPGRAIQEALLERLDLTIVILSTICYTQLEQNGVNVWSDFGDME
jgi:hypothetical protein